MIEIINAVKKPLMMIQLLQWAVLHFLEIIDTAGLSRPISIAPKCHVCVCVSKLFAKKHWCNWLYLPFIIINMQLSITLWVSPSQPHSVPRRPPHSFPGFKFLFILTRYFNDFNCVNVLLREHTVQKSIYIFTIKHFWVKKTPTQFHYRNVLYLSIFNLL